MNRISRLLPFLLSTLLFLSASGGVQAAVLRFEPTSFSGNPGDTFDVRIIVDPQGEAVGGSDVYIIYDSSQISTTQENVTTSADTFDEYRVTVDDGQVYLSGIFDTPTKSLTQASEMATIKFTLNTASPGTIQFYCDKTQNDTSKIVAADINGENIIECADLTAFSLNGGTRNQMQTGSTTIPTVDPVGSLPGTGGGGQQVVVQQQQQAPQQLMEAGIFENVIGAAVPGIILLAVGIILKILI
ncbi:MAG: hypothetical protein N2691_02790 [Patescibacteria group bacterium]|nr:hypothetical protein [Patescibacteria group bacterium]